MVVAAVFALLLLLAGCERDPPEEKSREGEVASSVPAAAPADYLQTASATNRPPAPAMAPQAPKPTAPLAPGSTCVTAECHATYSRAAHVHGPVNEKACNACHADDVGGHRFPLKRDKIQTCTFCHERVAGSASHQHAALKDGCTTCHDPHASPAKFLFKAADNVEQLCQKCHNIPLKKFAHDPFAKGRCTLCHEPHQSNNVKLLRGGEGKNHCYSCHGAMKQAVASALFVHQPVSQACTTCHSPHSTDYEHQLKAPVQQTCLSGGCHTKMQQHLASATNKHSATTSGLSCTNCHTAHASSRFDLLVDRTERLCLKCHDKPQHTPDGRTVENMKPVLTTSAFLHGPARAGVCSGCHDPHGANHPALLERSFPDQFYTSFDLKKYDLCFSCHEPELVLMQNTTILTDFRDGDVNLHYLHVNRDEKGRSCRTCHDMHGSDLPNHIASKVSFEGSKWAMPIEYRKTSAGGSCTPGCHETKSYDRTKVVKALASRPTTRGAS